MFDFVIFCTFKVFTHKQITFEHFVLALLLQFNISVFYKIYHHENCCIKILSEYLQNRFLNQFNKSKIMFNFLCANAAINKQFFFVRNCSTAGRQHEFPLSYRSQITERRNMSRVSSVIPHIIGSKVGGFRWSEPPSLFSKT